MNNEQAKVVGHDTDGIWVEAVQQSACSSCQARQGCGQQSLNKLGKPMRLWVNTDQRPSLGKMVMVTIPDSGLAISAMVLYGLPIFSSLLIALFANLLISSSDLSTAMGAIIGLFLGLASARYLSKGLRHLWQPTLSESGISTEVYDHY